MLAVIFWSIALSLAINGLMFVAAFRLKSDKLTDASYALSFIVLALFAFERSSKNTYAVVATTLVCIWALRIGSFLLYRVLRAGKDRRFDDLRNDFWRFSRFWLGQAITVWVLMLPTTLALSSRRSRITIVTLVGIVVWLLSLSVEAIADLQKYRFTHTPAHKGQWINSGLWHYSRHPNYFGEILIWLSIYLCALPSLSLTEKVIGAISPLFITILLLFVSGIPILEKDADKRWGNDSAYQAYKKRTSLLVPLPAKKI